MVIKTRARSQEAKSARKQQLLSAAAQLHRERGLNWTMLEVARRAGLAKGTSYLYFRTKEELLLELLTQKLSAWFEELESRLGHPGTDLAAELTQSIVSRPELVSLLAVQASILEQNLSLECAKNFKRFLLHNARRLAQQLETQLPGTNGLELLQWLNALVIGLAQLAEPAPPIKTLLEQEDLRPLRIEFRSALERSLRALLSGLSQQP